MSFISFWFASIPVSALPLLLACLGLILSERSGVVNLGAEGYMAVGAMSGASVTLLTGSPWLGVGAGVLAGCCLGLLFAFSVAVLKADQILSGLAVMAIGLGLSGFIGRHWVHQPFNGMNAPDLPGLQQLPLLGGLLFKQPLLAWVSILLVIVIAWILHRTRIGLRFTAVGEDPAAADNAGISVPGMQMLAGMLCGALCGLGGAYLSVASAHIWVDNMVAGRGWIALALVVFARWRPGRALIGALLFGAVDMLLPRLQAQGFQVPVYLMGMLPYLLTILVLVLATRSRYRDEPAALGVTYLRQDRH